LGTFSSIHLKGYEQTKASYANKKALFPDCYECDYC